MVDSQRLSCPTIFTSKRALIYHCIFFSFALLQKEFDLSLLWFLMNCFVMFLLIQTVYKENNNWELMSWYFYVLSIFTDFLCLCTYGTDLRKGENDGTHKSAQRFILSMAIFLFVPKPIFAFGIAKKLQLEGISLKSGLKNPKQSLASLDYQEVTNPGMLNINKQIENNNNNNNNMGMNNNNNNNNNFTGTVGNENIPVISDTTSSYYNPQEAQINQQYDNNNIQEPNVQPIDNDYKDFTSPGNDVV